MAKRDLFGERYVDIIHAFTMFKNGVTEETAEQAGFDCGVNGANGDNNHFKWFSRLEFTQAWERGHARAIKDKKGGT